MNVEITQKKYEKIIVKCVLKFVNPEGIFLYGGYGRNEGSWLIEKDKLPKPYNDFDILLVVNKKLNNDLIIKIKKHIKSCISIRWIDLSQIRLNKLKKLKNSIFNYDLKNASKVLYGNKKLQNLIPNLKPNEIPLKDIDILFKTRLWTLVGCFVNNSFEDVSGSKSIFFRNQMAKAVLACVDCYLILNKKYNFSYKKRVEFFLSNNEDMENFDLINWALNEKLRPKKCSMSSSAVKKMYLRVSKFFIKYFFIGLSKYYKCTIESEKDIERIYLYQPRNFLIRKLKNIINRSGDFNMYMVIIQFLCVKYLLNSNAKTLNKIKLYSKKIGVHEESFEKIRVKVSNLRIS
tara:strand:- start:1813 stop:2853 length:1041 start_codon:yes stop_codon:yes gene_type:complete